MLGYEGYNVVFFEVSITVFISKPETILESQLWIFVPFFNFVESFLNPVKLLAGINFRAVLIVYERQERFIVDHL